MPTSIESGLKLKVTEARSEDVGRGFARIDPTDRDRLGMAIGEIVEVVGKRRTVAKLMLTYPDQRGQARVQIDGVSRENAGAGIDQPVEIRKTTAQAAQHVVVRATLQLRPPTSSASPANSTACRSWSATASGSGLCSRARPISWSGHDTFRSGHYRRPDRNRGGAHDEKQAPAREVGSPCPTRT